MKKTLLALALGSMALPSLALDSIFVGGIRHTLTEQDFYVEDEGHKLDLEVIGDYGQELIFDIALRVKGDADKTRPSPSPLLFYFDAQLFVSCSGKLVGHDASYAYRTTEHGEVQVLVNSRMSFETPCTELKLYVPSSMLNKQIEAKLAIMEGF